MISTDEGEETVEKADIRLPLTPESEAPVESRGASSKQDGIYSQSWRKTPSRRQRNQDEVVFWRAMKQIADIRSPALNTAQLQQSFLNTYLSPDVRETHAPFYRIFYWESPQIRSLQASRDGLCLTHLGLRFGDRRMLMEGRKRHIDAINLLRQDLEALKTSDGIDEGVITAAFTLGNTEVFHADVSVPGAGYRQHVRGLEYMFRKRGAEGMGSKFGQSLLHNARHPGVIDSILKRKPNIFCEPDWIAAANKSPSLGVSLTNLAFQIPILLEKVDQTGGEDGEAVSLLSELTTLQRDLHDWLTRFYTLTNLEAAKYQRCSTNQFPRFQELCAGLGDVFPEMIEFPSFISATSHVYAWTCILLVRRAIFTVSERYAHPSVWSRGLKSAMIASVTVCAVDLCQSIAYLSLPEHLSCGILACSAPLYFASEWFEEQNFVQRLAWTHQVRGFLERGRSLGDGSESRHRLNPPMFLYWMLPNHIPEEPE